MKLAIFLGLLFLGHVPFVAAETDEDEVETNRVSNNLNRNTNINDNSNANIDIDSIIGDFFDPSDARAAVHGHSDIAAGKQDHEQERSFPAPPFFQAPSPIDLDPHDPHPAFSSPSQFSGLHASKPHFSSFSAAGNFPEEAFPPLDPIRGLAFLEYIRILLETYPGGGFCGPQKCDLSQFRKCTCVSPALFTPDGRGNCNLGVTKSDKRVWCYVSKKHGHPTKVCPDAREAKSRPGHYWSRIACITG